MKDVYIFYLKLPEEAYNPHVKNEEYVNYKHVNGSLSIIPFKNNDDNTRTYLYAFTDDKNFSKLYEDTHDMNMFTKCKEKMSKRQYKTFYKNNMSSYLIKYELDEHKDISIICPRHEKYEIDDSLPMFADTVIGELCTFDYENLKSKYIEILDRSFYCTFNKLYNSNYSDQASYNLSYNTTYEGYNKAPVNFNYNKLNLYTEAFSVLLK